MAGEGEGGGSGLPIRFGEQEEEGEQLAEGKWGGGGHRCSSILPLATNAPHHHCPPTNQLGYGSLLRVIARKHQRIVQTQEIIFLSSHY